MIITTLSNLFARDLSRLKDEISLYKSPEALWRYEKQILNSGGNLCLHLLGNLNTYIGAGLGRTNYLRDRELEFSAKDVPASELIERIEATSKIVKEALETIDDNTLNDEFPVVIWEQPTTMDFTLLHLLSHLNYHLGQINYHRRLLDTH